MTGYRQPPNDTRFKKGQSGNPKGRPRATNTSLTQSAKVTLDAADRKVTVREGGASREITALDAIMLAQQKSALAGSALAQKHFLDRHRAAEIERREQIAEDNERWELIVERLRFLRTEAAARGQEPSVPFPHPDDIVIDAEHGVRFLGPLDAEGGARLQHTLQLRDLLFAQDAFDHRSWDGASGRDVDDGPGTAALFAHVIDGAVPKRCRLSDIEILMMMDRYARMTKRELTKVLFRSWKSLGLECPRGLVFPSIRVGKQAITVMYDVLGGKHPDATDGPRHSG